MHLTDILTNEFKAIGSEIILGHIEHNKPEKASISRRDISI